MIEVHDVCKQFHSGKKIIHAVRNVSFHLRRGEILGIIGESGSGKSTLGRMLVRLETPTSGKIIFQGQPLHAASRDQIQMIFQDPFASLNPRMTVETILKEPSVIHKQKPRVDELLDLVGLPKNAKHRFPHEFSGGQRQRIGIARAIALNPLFIVCDEPTSALDMSIRAQILSLLQQLQKDLQLTYIFISHDLASVKQIATQIAVMHEGTFVEMSETHRLFTHPQHTYTQTLLDLFRN